MPPQPGLLAVEAGAVPRGERLRGRRSAARSGAWRGHRRRARRTRARALIGYAALVAQPVAPLARPCGRGRSCTSGRPCGSAGTRCGRRARGSTVPATIALRPARTLILRLPTPTFAMLAVGGDAVVPWCRSCAGAGTAPTKVMVVPSATAYSPRRSGESLKRGTSSIHRPRLPAGCAIRVLRTVEPPSPAREHLVRPRLGVAERRSTLAASAGSASAGNHTVCRGETCPRRPRGASPARAGSGSWRCPSGTSMRGRSRRRSGRPSRPSRPPRAGRRAAGARRARTVAPSLARSACTAGGRPRRAARPGATATLRRSDARPAAWPSRHRSSARERAIIRR